MSLTELATRQNLASGFAAPARFRLEIPSQLAATMNREWE